MNNRSYGLGIACIAAAAVLLLASALGRQTAIDVEVEGIGLQSNKRYPVVIDQRAPNQPDTVAVELPLQKIDDEPMLRFTFFLPQEDTTTQPVERAAAIIKWADVQKRYGWQPAMTFRVTKSDTDTPAPGDTQLQELLNQGRVDIALTMTQQFKEQLGPLAY